MVDKLTPERRSENMRRIKSVGMKPEMLVRRLIHSMGYRYRLHRKDLPGKPDLSFGLKRKAVFVHGCFWHGHDAPTCPDRRTVKSNVDYWSPKLARNRARDAEHLTALEAMGWQVLTIWECDARDMGALTSAIKKFLG